ncbi:MAG: acyl-CoA dehydrogenase family protein, partial [Pseudomonadota bacterium]|nr:acyl-CoA dehydrogenase family protein [Pseudomonadota bacterium]
VECDRNVRYPLEVQTKALEVGLLNLAVPTEFGGSGLGCFDVCLVSEQLAWGCAGIASMLTLNSVVIDALLCGANAEQQRKYFARLLNGEFGAYCATEPGAGSDVAGMQTRATKHGNDYLINGSKIWISNAPLASFFLVFAKTDVEAGGRGVTTFLVERDTPGVSVGKPLGKMGQRAAPAAEVFFDEVVVPAAAMLGGEGQGFNVAMKVFDRSRPMVAVSAVGLLQRCLDESLKYASGRKTMGKRIIDHQAIGHKVADLAMRLEASRLLAYQAAWRCDQGMRNTLQAAYAKAFAADSAMWAATETVQIFGGMGYSTEYPAEKLFRDAKVFQIYEGTSEIQRNIMVRELSRSA